MPRTRRQRTIAASPAAVWELISDPHHMPRWWPGIDRMEDVGPDRFTQVFRTRRGRRVRVDFSVVASDPPRACAWEQQVAGTPFERVLQRSVIELSLEDAGEGTRVTIEQEQRLRGYSRTGGLMLRRATRKRLDEALEGLARVF